MPNLAPISVAQFLVTIEGVTAYFTKTTAPKETRDDIEYNDGQTGTIRKITGFSKQDNVTLSKPYDPVNDAAFITWYKSRKQGQESKFTTIMQPVTADAQGTPLGQATKLTGCIVVSFKYPEADRLGKGLAMLEIEIHPDEVVQG